MKYRREIDGLRAVAVIPVILFHAGMTVFSGGFVGVDVFFVISGYLITSILISELDAGDFSIGRFYERRVRRILPALFLVMLCCIPFAWMWMLPSQLADFGKSLVAVTFFGSNMLFWRESSYFAPDFHLRPLQHTWSLAVEEQYYVLFPVALMLLWRLGRKKAFDCIVAVALVSLAISEWGWRYSPRANFYLAPGRAWELLAGSICAFIAFGRPQRTHDVLSAAGLAMIAFAIFYFDESTPFPSIYALLPVVGTALIICFAGSGSWVARLLGARAFVGIGLISYSAYLWHQPLFAFARIRAIGDPSPALMMGLAVLSLALAWFSWRYVEQPFRRAGKGPLPSRRSIFAASATIAAGIVAMGVSGLATGGFPTRASVLSFAELDYSKKMPPYRVCTDPELVRARLDMCMFLPGATADAALIGDSHADDKLYGLFTQDTARRWILLANTACPPVLNIKVESGQHDDCDVRARQALDYAAQDKAIHTVALAFYSNYALTTAYAADHLKNPVGPDHMRIGSRLYSGRSREEMFLNGLSDAVAFLLAHGKHVIILMDQPELPFFPYDCLKGGADCTVPLQQALDRQALYHRSIARIRDSFPTVGIFDPLALFCANGSCSYRRGDLILYRDSHHLTHKGSAAYARQFLAWEATTRPKR